jgi:hypothetical protein
MGFWIFMLLVNLLIPGTMICFGRIFLKMAPKEINSIIGYRTTMSMKNIDTWEFAHHYIGRIWYQWGLILLFLSIVVMIFVLGKDIDTVGAWGGTFCLLQCIPLVGAIVPTEQALKRTFDKNGVRK